MAANPDFDNLLQEALDLPEEKQIYCNGFIVSMSPADTIIVLQQNNKIVASLNVSHTIAKTLAIQLASIVDNFEKGTKTKISTLDEVIKAVQDANAK